MNVTSRRLTSTLPVSCFRKKKDSNYCTTLCTLVCTLNLQHGDLFPSAESMLSTKLHIFHHQHYPYKKTVTKESIRYRKFTYVVVRRQSISRVRDSFAFFSQRGLFHNSSLKYCRKPCRIAKLLCVNQICQGFPASIGCGRCFVDFS